MFGPGTTIRVHDQIVKAKLTMAVPRILALNAALTRGMLDVIKPAVEVATPTGPGHFGYHGRDTLKIRIFYKGVGTGRRTTVGQLMGAVQLYWREYGTRGYFRKGNAAKRARRQFMAAISGGGFGEHAFMPAHKAATAARRLVKVAYNGTASWWRF